MPRNLLPFQPVAKKGGYLAFLGRISPEKRPDLAIEIAARAGMPLKIAAKVDAADQQCTPQAWAAVAPLSLLQSCLGLHFDIRRGHIVFAEPLLPAFLDEMTLLRLSLGDASVNVRLRRVDGRVVVLVLKRHDDLKVLTLN